MISLAWTLAAAGMPGGGFLFHVSFDNTTTGTNGHGTPVPGLSVPGTATYTAGRQGLALVCGGDNGTLVSYPIAGNVHRGQGTIAMWVKAVNWSKNDRLFHVFFETQGVGWLVLYKFCTESLIMLSGPDRAHYGGAMMDQPCPLLDGQWHHLAGVWERKRLALYVDGVLRKSLPTPPLPKELTGTFTIGDAPWGTPQGKTRTAIDELTIYPYALPDDQISRLAKGQPLTYQPKVRVDVQPWPSRGQWKIMVDAVGLTTGDGGRGAKATVEVVGGDTAQARAAIAGFTEGQANTVVDIAQVPAGSYTVRAIVQDATGREVARGEIPFAKPADAPWVDNKLGMTDKVLAPFTPMAADKGTRAVGCWGRSYAMDGVFPSQIHSAGQPMLARPMYLDVTTTKGRANFTRGGGQITQSSATRVEQSGSADSSAFRLTAETTIEYDGMLWTEVTLTPKSSVTLANATLHIPVKAAHAIFFHHARGDFGEDNAGSLPSSGYSSLNFQPYLWVGNDDRGLAWFAESRQGWSNAVGVPMQRIVRAGDTVEMQIAFINQPVSVNKPLHFSFGLQATPVKPRPADARSWRLCGVGADFDSVGKGNLQVIWCNGHLTFYGYPEAQNPKQFKTFVADRHRQGIRAITYLNLNFMSVGAPESAYYSLEWVDPSRSFAVGDVAQMGYATYGACPHSKAWRDFVAYKIARFVEDYHIDGIYVDCWSGNECLEEGHGCGWRDAGGALHGRYPYRDYREILRRVREIFQDRRPNSHVMVHMSATAIIPILSFADSMLDGEQYQGPRGPNDDYLMAIPMDKWRAEHTGRPLGVVPFLLPEFAGDNRTTTTPTERLMGLLLAHDINLWPTWCNTQTVFNTWNLTKGFGIDNSTFLPYWTSNGVSTGNSQVVTSVYQKPGQALLVVLNSGTTPASATVTVDGTRLLGSNLWQAQDPTDNSSLSVRQQSIRLENIPGRGHRLIVIRQQESNSAVRP